MSVIITNMDMPANCYECGLVYQDSAGDLHCPLVKDWEPTVYNGDNIEEGCPLMSEIDGMYAFELHKETGCPLALCVDAHEKAIEYLRSFGKVSGAKAKSYVDCQQCKYHRNPSYIRCKKCEETNGGEYEVQNIIEETVKPIDYKDCATAMMYMWLNEIVTDSQYYKIMDKLNAKYKEGLI